MPSFSDLTFTAGKIRYQTALRREILHVTGYRSWKCKDIHMCHMLKAYRILKVTDSHVCALLEQGIEYSRMT